MRRKAQVEENVNQKPDIASNFYNNKKNKN